MISLIIEHMIGLTDAVFLGRVGTWRWEHALWAACITWPCSCWHSASALAHKSSLRAATGNAVTTGLPHHGSGLLFHAGPGGSSFAASQYFSPSSCGTSLNPHRCTGPQWITCTGAPTVFFLLPLRHVPSLLRGDYPDEDSDGQFHCHAPEQCRVKLLPHFWERRLSAAGIAGAAIASSVSEAVSLLFSSSTQA